jgi:hypothetical protein
MKERLRRRSMYYSASSLHDGTVLAAYPMRRPAPRILKRDGMRIDVDGVTSEWGDSGRDLSNWEVENRFRFQDIIANRLNTRRAIRELVLAPLTEMQCEISALREEVGRLTALLQRCGPAGDL